MAREVGMVALDRTERKRDREGAKVGATKLFWMSRIATFLNATELCIIRAQSTATQLTRTNFSRNLDLVHAKNNTKNRPATIAKQLRQTFADENAKVPFSSLHFTSAWAWLFRGESCGPILRYQPNNCSAAFHTAEPQ